MKRLTVTLPLVFAVSILDTLRSAIALAREELDEQSTRPRSRTREALADEIAILERDAEALADAIQKERLR